MHEGVGGRGGGPGGLGAGMVSRGELDGLEMCVSGVCLFLTVPSPTRGINSLSARPAISSTAHTGDEVAIIHFHLRNIIKSSHADFALEKYETKDGYVLSFFVVLLNYYHIFLLIFNFNTTD